MTSHEIEQALAQMRDTMPRLWWAMYQGCLQAGFDRQQAFGLVATWILSQNPAGIRPDNPTGGMQGEGE